MYNDNKQYEDILNSPDIEIIDGCEEELLIPQETPDNYDDITEDSIASLPEEERMELEKEYEYHSRYPWRLSKVEYARWEKFQEDHRNCMRLPDGRHRFGTIGGGISISFMGTGLGNLVSCKCHTCGKSVNITDCSNW